MNNPRISCCSWCPGTITILSFLVLLVSCKHHREVVVTGPPVGWINWATPDRVDSLARKCASNAKVFNDVIRSGDSVSIEPHCEENHFTGALLTEPLPFPFQPAGVTGARKVRRLNDGWLVGYSHGEFGGSLWFLSSDGSKSKRILNENVTKMQEIFGRMFVFTNTAGQGFRGGAIYEVADGGVIKNHLDFDAAPLAFAQDSSSSILVASDSGVYRVSSNLKQKEILKRDLSGFEPNSIVVAGDRTIYIGMRFFVLRIIPGQAAYKEQWLVPAACKDFHVDPEQQDCICDSPSSATSPGPHL